jgi:hypothetical protein
VAFEITIQRAQGQDFVNYVNVFAQTIFHSGPAESCILQSYKTTKCASNGAKYKEPTKEEGSSRKFYTDYCLPQSTYYNYIRYCLMICISYYYYFTVILLLFLGLETVRSKTAYAPTNVMLIRKRSKL